MHLLVQFSILPLVSFSAFHPFVRFSVPLPLPHLCVSLSPPLWVSPPTALCVFLRSEVFRCLLEISTIFFNPTLTLNFFWQSVLAFPKVFPYLKFAHPGPSSQHLETCIKLSMDLHQNIRTCINQFRAASGYQDPNQFTSEISRMPLNFFDIFIL